MFNSKKKAKFNSKIAININDFSIEDPNDETAEQRRVFFESHGINPDDPFSLDEKTTEGPKIQIAPLQPMVPSGKSVVIQRPCRNCFGIGQIKGKDCRNCQGTGDEDNAGHNRFCPTCNGVGGTGKPDKNSSSEARARGYITKCKTCNGSSVIEHGGVPTVDEQGEPIVITRQFTPNDSSGPTGTNKIKAALIAAETIARMSPETTCPTCDGHGSDEHGSICPTCFNFGHTELDPGRRGGILDLATHVDEHNKAVNIHKKECMGSQCVCGKFADIFDNLIRKPAAERGIKVTKPMIGVNGKPALIKAFGEELGANIHDQVIDTLRRKNLIDNTESASPALLQISGRAWGEPADPKIRTGSFVTANFGERKPWVSVDQSAIGKGTLSDADPQVLGFVIGHDEGTGISRVVFAHRSGAMMSGARGGRRAQNKRLDRIGSSIDMELRPFDEVQSLQSPTGRAVVDTIQKARSSEPRSRSEIDDGWTYTIHDIPARMLAKVGPIGMRELLMSGSITHGGNRETLDKKTVTENPGITGAMSLGGASTYRTSSEKVDGSRRTEDVIAISHPFSQRSLINAGIRMNQQTYLSTEGGIKQRDMFHDAMNAVHKLIGLNSPWIDEGTRTLDPRAVTLGKNQTAQTFDDDITDAQQRYQSSNPLSFSVAGEPETGRSMSTYQKVLSDKKSSKKTKENLINSIHKSLADDIGYELSDEQKEHATKMAHDGHSYEAILSEISPEAGKQISLDDFGAF